MNLLGEVNGKWKNMRVLVILGSDGLRLIKRVENVLA